MARHRKNAAQRAGAVAPGKTSPRRSGTIIALSVLLALSLAGNFVLAWRTSHAGAAPAPAEPAAAQAPPAATPPSAVGAPTQLPAELRPYAGLGTYVAATNRIPDLGWTEAQFAAFAEGLRACYAGRPYPFDDDAQQLRADINQKVEAMLSSKQSNPVEEYFAMLRDKEGVQRAESNLHYRVTEPGDGPVPALEDTVVVSYSARLPGGQAVPSLTRARVRAKAGDLLPGLREGVRLLSAGGKALVYLPPALSFGDGRWPEDVPPGSPIAFFLELHEVEQDDW